MSITRRVAALCVALFALLASLPAQAQSAIPTTNLSVSVGTGLTYQSIQGTSAGRRSLTIQNNNTNTDNCWINVDGNVVAGNATSSSVTVNGASITAAKASVLLQPGEAYTRYYPFIPKGPIVGTCASSGDSIYADVQ